MKANELMIGDWVECVDSTHKEKVYAQIDAIEEGQTCILVRLDNCNWFLDISFIKPTPLTPEILKKNGFVNDRGIYCWRDENKQITYFSKENNRPYCTYSFVNIESGCIVVDELPIEYVHELQHAMRICGIEKEIVL